MIHLALPNMNWVRSPVMPDWALCLYPEADFFGWKMYELNGKWISGGKLTLNEVQTCLVRTPADLIPHLDQLADLESQLKH